MQALLAPGGTGPKFADATGNVPTLSGQRAHPTETRWTLARTQRNFSGPNYTKPGLVLA